MKKFLISRKIIMKNEKNYISTGKKGEFCRKGKKEKSKYIIKEKSSNNNLMSINYDFISLLKRYNFWL